MKKKILLIIILLVILIIIAFLLKQTFIPKQNTVNNQYTETNPENDADIQISIEQNLYPVGDYNLEDNSKNVLIKSYDELNSYLSTTYTEDLNELLSKYTDSFFENQALALAYIKLENPNKSLSITSLDINENNLEIGYSSNNSAYIAVVETDKTLSSITSAEK